MPVKKRTFAVQFGSAGTIKGDAGKENAGSSIGVSVPKSKIQPNDLEALVTKARLKVTMDADPLAAKDVDGQEGLPGVDTTTWYLKGVECECGGFSSGEEYGLRLKFHGDAVGYSDIAKFAYHSGKLTLERLGDVVKRGADNRDHDDPAE